MSDQAAASPFPTANVKVTDFAGLNLSQDRRTFKAPTVVDGANFTLTAGGVRSDFGDDIITETELASPSGIKTFREDGYIILASTSVLFRFDASCGCYYPVFQFTDAGNAYPWTQAFVGGDYYYAKYGVGLICHRMTDDRWFIVTGGDVPSNIYGVCQAGGRAVVAALGLVAWSDIDDGTTWTTDVTTGTGSVDLSVIAQADIPLGIAPISNGWIVSTAVGMGRGIVQDATSPFFTSQLTIKDVPINPFCFQPIDGGKVVYLAKSGFWITQTGWSYNEGDQPKMWEAATAMGEYFVQDVMPALDLSLNAVIRLDYNIDRKWFMASVAAASSQYLYTRSFVLYLGNNKWGSFDKLHYCFGELDLQSGPFKGYNFGYVDENGLARKFTPNAAHTDGSRQTDTTIYWQPPSDMPAQGGIGGSTTPTIFMTYCHLDAQDFTGLLGLDAGIYDLLQVFNEAIDPITAPTLNDDPLDPTYSYDDWSTNPYGEPDEDWSVLVGSDDWDDNGYEEIIFITQIRMQSGQLVYNWQLAASNYADMGSFAVLGPFRFDDGVDEDRLSYTGDIVLGTNVQATFTSEDWSTSTDPNEDWHSISNVFDDWGADFPSASNFTAKITGTLDAFNTFEEEDHTLTPNTTTANSIYYKQQCTGVFHLLTLETAAAQDFFYLKYAGIQGTLAGRLN